MMGDHAQSPGIRPEFQALKRQAVELLRTAMRTEKEFIRIHAAEALLNSGYSEGIHQTFAPEVNTAGPKYRIGVWRVMAQLAGKDAKERERYVLKMITAFLDRNGEDRVHALETLGKLGYSLKSADMVQVARGEAGLLQIMARWILANSGKEEDETALVALLASKDAHLRGIAAYALRYLKQVRPATLAKLEAAARSEPSRSEARVYLWAALAMHLPKDRRDSALSELRKYVQAGNAEEKFEAGFVIGLRGDKSDLPAMEKLLTDNDTDARVVAAQAILFILDREQKDARPRHTEKRL